MSIDSSEPMILMFADSHSVVRMICCARLAVLPYLLADLLHRPPEHLSLKVVTAFGEPLCYGAVSSRRPCIVGPSHNKYTDIPITSKQLSSHEFFPQQETK